MNEKQTLLSNYISKKKPTHTTAPTTEQQTQPFGSNRKIYTYSGNKNTSKPNKDPPINQNVAKTEGNAITPMKQHKNNTIVLDSSTSHQSAASKNSSFDLGVLSKTTFIPPKSNKPHIYPPLNPVPTTTAPRTNQKEDAESDQTEILDESIKISINFDRTPKTLLSSKKAEISLKCPLKCPQYILIGPFHTITCDSLEQQLEALMLQCTKKTLINFIRSKIRINSNLQNLANLQRIEDEDFWCTTMQNIIELLLRHKQQLDQIRTLCYVGVSQTIALTRLQVLLLVSSMFLCIIPHQSYTKMTSLAQLMGVRSSDQHNKKMQPVRYQKLLCVVNYLKNMSENHHIFKEKIILQRAVSYDKSYLVDVGHKLLPARITPQRIEQGYKKGLIIDFANAEVGGGFLTNGCAQQEILFSCFPQLTVIKLLCVTLHEQEAIIVRNARRFNTYQGYSHSFQFTGNYAHNINEENNRSVIVAVDAVDFTHKPNYCALQYKKYFLRRELHKMWVGLTSGYEGGGVERAVFTGRWGCGVFGGNEWLKFCLQWAACSICKAEMVFSHDDQSTRNELRALSHNLAGRGVDDLLGLLQQFGSQKCYSERGLLNYLKDYS